MGMPEPDNDSESGPLFQLTGQMVQRLRFSLPGDDEVDNVLVVHGMYLARFIFRQMQQHYWKTPTD